MSRELIKAKLGLDSNAVECTFEKSTVAKLRKRIHLPPDVYATVHEERHIVGSVSDFLKNYTYKDGWSVCYLDNRVAIVQALEKEVILRQHPKFGKFILFRIYRR